MTGHDCGHSNAGEPLSSGQNNVEVVVGESDDSVVMSFDKNIGWLKLNPISAIEVAEMLKEKGIEILRREEAR